MFDVLNDLTSFLASPIGISLFALASVLALVLGCWLDPDVRKELREMVRQHFPKSKPSRN